MVKAGALGDAHVKSWDRTWSNPDSKKVHIGRCVWFQSRPQFYMAGVSQILKRGQDGRVVKAGALEDAHVKSWNRTWSNPDFEKVHIGRCVGFNHVRNSIWQA